MFSFKGWLHSGTPIKKMEADTLATFKQSLDSHLDQHYIQSTHQMLENEIGIGTFLVVSIYTMCQKAVFCMACLLIAYW